MPMTEQMCLALGRHGALTGAGPDIFAEALIEFLESHGFADVAGAAREQFKNVGAADEDGLYGYGGGEWEEKCDAAWRTVAKMVEMLAEGSEPGPVMKYGQDALDRDE